jgi:hypothetical protein
VNEIVAVIVRLNLFELHRLIAIDASHEVQQRATIVIHVSRLNMVRPRLGHFRKRSVMLSVNIGRFKRRRTRSTV